MIFHKVSNRCPSRANVRKKCLLMLKNMLRAYCFNKKKNTGRDSLCQRCTLLTDNKTILTPESRHSNHLCVARSVWLQLKMLHEGNKRSNRKGCWSRHAGGSPHQRLQPHQKQVQGPSSPWQHGSCDWDSGSTWSYLQDLEEDGTNRWEKEE